MSDALDDILGPANPNQRSKAYTMTAQERAEFDREFYQQLNDSMTPFERFAVGAGRGFNTIGRATGLVDSEPRQTKQAAEDLTDRYTGAMVGEIVGEAAPFAPLGLGAGAKALADKLALRVLYSAGVGALEGGAIALGKDQDIQQVAASAGLGGVLAGGLEAVFPVVGRLGRQVFQRLGRTPKGPLLSSAGEPTQELLSALDSAGMSWEDLTDEAVDFVTKNQDQITDPAAVARRSRFDQQGIPYTLGDITQDFSQQAGEQQLLSSAVLDGSEPLRELKLRQSGQFERAATDLAGEFGDGTKAGASTKSALSQRKQLLRQQKNRAYRQAEQQAPELMGVPIAAEGILAALPDARTMRRLSRLEGAQVGALQDLLVEFGLDSSDDAVEAFTKSGGEITPLTMGNFEDFRSGVNQIIGADRTGAASVAAGPVIEALDAAVDATLDQLPNTADEMVGLLKTGRAKTRQLKTEFSPQAIAGRLTGKKPDGYTPIVEASKVVDELYSKPPEQLRRTLSALTQTGQRGKAAIGDLRAAVVLRALDDALKAPSRKINGIEVVGGNQFAKSLAKFGDEKIELLFKGDKAGLNAVRHLAQTGKDIQPTAGALPKGSASVNLDIAARVLGKMSKAPVLGEVAGIIRLANNQRAEAGAMAAAMNAKPELKRTAKFIEAELPALAATLGIAGLVNEKEPQ